MSSAQFYFGLALVTAGTLMLQVIETRILSVMTWYHLAFFAISMGMFGLTAGAVFVYLRGDRFTDRTLSHDLAYYSAAFAVVTVLSVLIQTTLVPSEPSSASAIWTWLELAVCMSLPFFYSGIVVSLALTRSPFPIGRVYAADMLGAALGCIGVLVLLNLTDATSAVLWVGALAGVAALCFSNSSIGTNPDVSPPLDFVFSRRKTILAVLVVAALANGSSERGIQPIASKNKLESPNSYIFREWNSFSRIAVMKEHKRPPYLWGGSPTLPGETLVSQRYLNIDGLAGTPAYRFSGDLEEVDFVNYDVTNLVYFLPERERVAIIGVGGGRDVISAAVSGRTDITAVEMNPIFVKLLTTEPGFSDFTGLEHFDDLKFVVDEGRSWFARTPETFDIIQMSLIDTWAATGAGAFTLSENGLYTTEAWHTFLSRLSPEGIFTVSRWYGSEDVNETGRMISLATAVLLEMRVANPKEHIFVAAQGRVATLLVSKAPFSKEEIELLEDVSDRYEHEVIINPAKTPESLTLMTIVNAPNLDELFDFTSHLSLDLTPPSDDRPFFFNQLPVNQPVKALRHFFRDAPAGVLSGNLVATGTLVMLFFLSLFLVIATIVIPLRPALKDVGGQLVTGGTLYFLLIGAGFMMTEIGLLQRMSVFLGHPIYSLSVLLFTLILATGIGSLLSDILVLNSRQRLGLWALFTGCYIASLPLWLPSTLAAFESSALFPRAALCVATIGPAGVLMGFGFPTGMRLISEVDSRPTPWFWGVNGAAGVLASVAAIAISIAAGISATVVIGAACYVLLIPVVFTFFRPSERVATL